MNKFRILQIGDIHYPWTAAAKPAADFGTDPDQISGVSDRISIANVALNKLTSSITSICDVKPDVVAFVGDYTVKGDEAGLIDAIKYATEGILKRVFDDSELATKTIFVPGNHDVVRPQNFGSDPYEKFSLYQSCLEGLGINNHSTKNFGRVNINCENGEIVVLGINTCLGCGEFRALPTTLRDSLSSILNDYRDEHGQPFDPATLSGVAERLDIPFLDRQDIDGLDVELSNDNQRKVCVVIGHHNLLPQRETRVLAYGELLNSGVLREILSTKTHPVLYLHGHIHSEPVELIRDPLYPDGGILSVSAPLITEGVNVIDVFCDDDLDIVGVDVIPWRFSPTHHLKRERSLKVSLAHGENRLSSLHEKAREIFRYLVDAGDTAHRHLTQLSDEVDLDIEETARHCQALAWAGLVTVSSSHKGLRKWDVRLAI